MAKYIGCVQTALVPYVHLCYKMNDLIKLKKEFENE